MSENIDMTSVEDKTELEDIDMVSNKNVTRIISTRNIMKESIWNCDNKESEAELIPPEKEEAAKTSEAELIPLEWVQAKRTNEITMLEEYEKSSDSDIDTNDCVDDMTAMTLIRHQRTLPELTWSARQCNMISIL